MNFTGSTPTELGRRLTVTQKIISGYLVVAMFSLAAILFALHDIQQQVEISGDLVNRDFQAITLVRDLRENILAQERLEQQILILKDDELLELLKGRQLQFEERWQDLDDLELEETIELNSPAQELVSEREKILSLLTEKKRRTAESYIKTRIAPLRLALLNGLDDLAKVREVLIDAALLTLNRDSLIAYRITLILLILGIALGGGVAYRVVRSITRSINHLSEAARQASDGRFEFTLEEFGRDEFGYLASEFQSMGKRLLDLKNQLLDANPLTHLPGNLAIDHELERRIVSLEPFAHVYIDLDHFKAYNDRYGYQKGSEVIARIGDIIQETVLKLGNPEDLVGHIGGDDYLLLTTPEKSEELAEAIIARFDHMTDIYTEEDLNNGYYEGVDRFGDHRRYPLMSISIAIILSENMDYPTAQEISAECAKMKEHLKNLPGSNYLVDRRRR
jgi:GGDEF domain-containing protein